MDSIFQSNIVTIAIVLFMTCYGILFYVKPSFLYHPNGGLRTFGVGYKNKTILPMWLLSLLLGIICYLAVLYYFEFQQYI